MSNEQTILVEEDYKIFDRLASQSNPFAKGWVRIFMHKKFEDKGKPVFEGPNLIVGNGREFSAQKLFNTNSGSSNDWKNYIISSFGVGSGGATISDSQPVLNDPTLDDTGLFSPISLNESYDTEQSSSTVGVVKPITNAGSIVLMDGDYGTGTYYSKVKCTCVVNDGEPTSLAFGESQQISEAGLYFTSGTNNNMFSHICFSPKWIELSSVFTIEWMIIC